jgi:hypothetical protein
MEYTIVIGDSPEDLFNRVNALIKQGWIPPGGISVLNIIRQGYFQAMIREKP